MGLMELQCLRNDARPCEMLLPQCPETLIPQIIRAPGFPCIRQKSPSDQALIPRMHNADREHPCTNVYTARMLFAYFQASLFMQLSAEPTCLFIFVVRGNGEERSAY